MDAANKFCYNLRLTENDGRKAHTERFSAGGHEPCGFALAEQPKERPSDVLSPGQSLGDT